MVLTKIKIRKILMKFVIEIGNTGFEIHEIYDFIDLKKTYKIVISGAVSYTEYEGKTLKKCYEVFKGELLDEGKKLIKKLESEVSM